MLRLLRYYSQFTTVRGNLTGLPGWGRLLLTIFAIPGILLILLSILALLVSIATLLLLTAPVYRLVQWVAGPRQMRPQTVTVSTPPSYEPEAQAPRTPRRHVDVTIIE